MKDDRQPGNREKGSPPKSSDSLETFGIYQLARQLFDDFWDDSEILARDFRGRELAKQQIRSLDSVCANMEEAFGRGFGKELPQHLKISRGGYNRHLLSRSTIVRLDLKRLIHILDSEQRRSPDPNRART